MAFRLNDHAPQYRDALGNLLSGGSLNFFITNTTTPKSVYGEKALSTNNGSVLTLGSDGRTAVDVWGSGTYKIVLKDSAGNVITTRNDVQDVDPTVTVTVPAPTTGTNGQVVTTDGTTYSLTTILAVPSLTGNSGKTLTNDGTTASWTTMPTTVTLPTGGVLQDATTFTVGKMKVQLGTDTAPSNSSGITTTKAVTFATAYSTTPKVLVSLTGSGGHTPQGAKVTFSVVVSTTGFTLYCYAADEHDVPGWFITNTVPFDYVAIGVIA